MEQVSDVVLTPAPSFAPIAGASITVTDANGDPATLYAGNGTGQLLSHVLYSDTYGRYSFFAANGRYTLTIAATGYTTVARELVLFDRAQDQILDLEEFGSVDITGVVAADSAIAAVLAYIQGLNPTRGATLQLPRGTVRSTTPLVNPTSARGVTIQGVGYSSTTNYVGPTTLLIDHDQGAAIRNYASDFTLRDLNIVGTLERRNDAGFGTTLAPNVGLHCEAPDAAGGAGSIQRVRVENVAIQRQPSHGVLHSGNGFVLDFHQVHINYSGGHGYWFSRGQATGRTNLSYIGSVNIFNGRSHDNGGHLIALGEPADTGLSCLRFNVVNLEGYRNCSNNSILFAPAFIVVGGQNNTFETCATGGEDDDGDPYVGIWIVGRVHRFNNIRYIRCSQPAHVAEGGVSTRDIEFNGMTISSPGLTPFAYAVTVQTAALVNQVRVINHADQRGVDSQYVKVLQCNHPGYYAQDSDGIRADFDVEYRSFSSSPELSLPDDAVQELDFGGIAAGILMVSCSDDSTCTATVAFRVASNPEASDPWIVEHFVGANVVTGTGVLTAGDTDGVNGRLNIYTSDTGKLYVKNRRAASRRLRLTILGGLVRRTVQYAWQEPA